MEETPMNPDAWRLRLRLLLAVVSGGIAFCSFPPVDFGWASMVALVPLFLALRGARGRAGLFVGLAFGLAFMGPLIWWISLFGYLGWSVLVVEQALFFAAFGWFAAWASRSGWGRVVAVPLMVTAAEVLRTRWPLGGFAWGDLGYAQHDGGSLLALARIGGVHTVTLALAAINALIAQVIVTGRVWRRMLAGAVAAGIAVGPLWLPLGLAGPRTDELDVALVQGNVSEGRFTGFADRIGREGPEDLTIIQNHVRLSEPLASRPPELVVWPENAVDRDPFTNPQVGQVIEQTVRRVGAPFIIGTILDGPGNRFRNANLLYDTTGHLTSPHYEKIHLVPFGEYVPWPRLRRYIKALDQIPADGLPGKTPVVFDIGKTKIGTVICFESTYPSLARDLVGEGAELLVVTTNDASFRRSPASSQHVAMSQLRAVEEGRTVLHAAISGITAVIDARGQILRRTGLFEPAVVRRTVPLARGRTPYGRFGDATELGMLGLGAIVALLTGARMFGGRRDRRYTAAEQELWGAEETLRRAISERETADKEIAERIASQAGSSPPEAPPGDGAA
jgi:apolipoprotein N-acyltransferase